MVKSPISRWCEDKVPLYGRFVRLPKQVLRISPFDGDSRPSRVPLVKFKSSRQTVPFPHPWNFEQPLKILDAYFADTDEIEGAGKHNRYLDVPGFAPVLVTRDPAIIRAITTETGDRAGQFDRDTLPSTGIARATGKDTLLFANGFTWRRQRKIAASPFGKTTLFQPERFHEFEETFRQTVRERLKALRQYLTSTGSARACIRMEPEIKAVMLEMLTNNFFGAEIPYDELKERYVPALERVIDHIVRDTVINRLRLPMHRIPGFTRSIARLKRDQASFDQLTDAVLAMRKEARGLWSQFKSDAPDEALRSNLKVFLAGALEATTSYASWAIAHLARNPTVQQRVFQAVQDVDDYTPDNLKRARYLGHVMDETLRLTPSLYFLPRYAKSDTWIETADRRRMFIPGGTHVLLDIWHANRHEDHWGVAVTGFPALEFVPERWAEMADRGRASKEMLHFGFGHGPRVCPGQHLGQLEVCLVVGAFVKMFKFTATSGDYAAKAGVSTKPLDGVSVELEPRAIIAEASASGSELG